VAVSRIHDNKHYLSDVIFGAALGTTVGRAFALNYNKMDNNIVITPQMQLKFTFPL
jgi:membrane-associated phospholipid phosphatase